jgi:hypothetical protein
MQRVRFIIVAALIVGLVAAAAVGASWKWNSTVGKAGASHKVAGWSWGDDHELDGGAGWSWGDN